MVRGYQRRIIFVKNTGSPQFDEAYFVISDKSEKDRAVADQDLIKEANRIIEDSDVFGPVRQRSSFKDTMKKVFFRVVLPFLIGLITGVIITAAIR